MTEREHFRDEGLGAALRALEVPEHRPGFDEELRRLLEQQRPRPALRPWAVPTAVLVGGAAVAAAILLLVGLPSGSGPSSALAARVKAVVAERFSTGLTLSGRIVYRSYGLRGPARSSASFAMDASGNLRSRDPQTHAVAVYEAADGIERSLNTSASIGGKTLFAAERRGIAPGPPDGGPSEEFLQPQLTSFARALLTEPDPRIQPTTYAGRKAWQATIDVAPNRLFPDYDRLEITIDATTGVPVHVVGTLRGKRRFELRVEQLAVDARLRAGVFALRFPRGKEVMRENDRFRRVDLSRVAARTGYAPLVPERIPEGYDFDLAAVAQRSLQASVAVVNPPSRKVFSLSYRRGFEQFIVTTRLRRSGSGRWHDPLGVEGVPLHPERVTLHGGPLNGAVAQVVVDPRAVPHLWALTDDLVVTVSGDLSRRELIAVAQSLHPFGGAAASSCSAGDLRLQVGLQGATGSLLGAARFTNTGNRTCTLAGSPRLEIERGGRPLPIRVASAKPAYPPVELRPGRGAHVYLSWRNWCGGTVDRLTIHVVLSGGGSLSAPLAPDTPRCDDTSSPSTLGVGWFRPPE
jgi:uncharacterized protein DUF4232